MATLKAYQVAAAALLGGFSPHDVPTAVAVAKGESSFNTKSSNSCCQGLWQIHRTAHADKIKKYGGVDKLDDPVVNAKIAHEIFSAAGGWCTSGRVPNCNPWQAYGVSNGTGSWKSKLKEGADAYAQVQNRKNEGDTLAQMVNEGLDRQLGFDVPDPSDIPGVGGLLDTAGSIAGLAKAIVDFGNRIGAWVSDPQSWIRIAEVVGGTLLVTIGLRIAFNKQVNAFNKAVLGAVLPGGKVAKAAQLASSVKGK